MSDIDELITIGEEPIPFRNFDSVFPIIKRLVPFLKRAKKLEVAIKEHRAQQLDDRCWLDDQKLYAVLEDGDLGDNRTPPMEEMLKNCKRYLETRCQPGPWKTYQQLEAELANAKKEIEALRLRYEFWKD